VTSSGGQSCTTATLTCVVSGLTNGTAYTFTVVSTNSIGSSSSSSASASVTPAAAVTTPSGGSSGGGSSGGGSAPAAVTTTPAAVTPTVVTTTPAPVTTAEVVAPTTTPAAANANTEALTPTAPVTPIPAGQATLDIRDSSGAVVPATSSVAVSPVDANVLVVSIPSSQVQVSLSSTAPNGSVNPVQNTTLTIASGSEIKISAEGFLPNSDVSVYVFSTPVLLGTVKTDAQGKYITSLASPSGLEIGAHTIQLIGYLKDSSVAKLSIPMVVFRSSVSKTIKVYFDMSSTKISASQLKSLKNALSKVNKKKILSIAIKGFAQKTAKQKNDDKLIQLRASNVAKALKSLGITTKSSISTGGYALEKDERARRVEIVIKIAQ
jgi:outer membrane protein OmpA-like peptidoglycan-associated protein